MTEKIIKHVVIRLPDQVYKVLKNICETFGLTVNGYVKVIILEYLINNNYIENLEIKNGVLIAKN